MATKNRSKGLAVASDDKWQVENDLRTLAEAAAIKRDPKRLAKVQAMAKEKMMDMAAVASSDNDSDD